MAARHQAGARMFCGQGRPTCYATAPRPGIANVLSWIGWSRELWDTATSGTKQRAQLSNSIVLHQRLCACLESGVHVHSTSDDVVGCSIGALSNGKSGGKD